MILNHQLTLNKTLSGECVEICQRGKTFDPVIAFRWNTVTGCHKMDLAFDERAYQRGRRAHLRAGRDAAESMCMGA